MKLLIILNGVCEDYSFLKTLSQEFDCIYCADGGYLHAIKAGIKPDMVLGDFDSSKIPDNVKVLKFPVEKNETDAEITINEGIKNGFTDITLTCTLGGRCDHLLTNILMLVNFKRFKIEEENCLIEVIDKFKVLENFKGKTVSLIPIEKTHVYLTGFKYPLNGEVNIGTTLTMSNIVEENVAEIKIKYGKVIMIITK